MLIIIVYLRATACSTTTRICEVRVGVTLPPSCLLFIRPNLTSYHSLLTARVFLNANASADLYVSIVSTKSSFVLNFDENMISAVSLFSFVAPIQSGKLVSKLR
jgi:hypothetical protein